MDEDDATNKLNHLLTLMQPIHFPSSYVHSVKNKIKVLADPKENELETIYNLIESHAAGIRYTSVERYQKTFEHTPDDDKESLNRNTINFKCNNTNTDNLIKIMKEQLEEMPKEWTLVQLTSQYNFREHVEIESNKYFTNALQLTVLNCGGNQLIPFTITIEPPIDPISHSSIEIRQEMFDILKDNENNLTRFRDKYKKSTRFLSKAEKLTYVDQRNMLNNRLESLINVIQNKWLEAWRSLFIGKFVNHDIEEKVTQAVEDRLRQYNYQDISQKNKALLIYLLKGSGFVNLTSAKKGIKYIFPKDQDKNVRYAFIKLMQSKEFNFEDEKRHPVILIVDEPLDFIPWEMIDILQKQSVSRLPSLHFVYSLFKEYEKTIVNGFLEIYSTANASYLLNPGLDLNAMQLRMNNFFKYWRPDWTGVVGVEPTEDDFLEILKTSDIFIYCGHGSGTQFLRGEVIQKTKIKSIVFLFGCGSIKLCLLGPQAETSSSYFNYLIASSPCVIGMLWVVTDFETDSLAAELFSKWIPSEASTHWDLIVKDKWSFDGSLTFMNKKQNTSNTFSYEPELLKALASAKTASGKYITRAACVARGLPVKIVT